MEVRGHVLDTGRIRSHVRPLRKGAVVVTATYDGTCTTCGHKINDHDANECWNYEAHGEQCHCPWMGVPDE